MKITGIICEYNPLHNGHLYHIQKTRENGATHIVAVMSGNYVQRGEIAVLDKFERAKLAVRSGADIVIEIPAVYSLSSAEFYARGAVWLLNSLGCVDELSFGSEVGSVEELENAARIAFDCQQSSQMEELLRSGMSYPNAVCNMVYRKYGSKLGLRIGDILASPNNVLAIEYLKAIQYFGSGIKPFTIHRKSVAHDSTERLGNIASASYIRKCIEDGTDFHELVPERVFSSFSSAVKQGRIADMKNLERILIYKLRTTTAQEIAEVPDVGQGLENRIIECAHLNSVDEILQGIKTKRYTMSRIRRILFNMLIGVKKSDLKILPPYARLLASSERGRDVLARAKETSSLPVDASLAKLSRFDCDAKRFAEIEGRASDIYALAQKKIGRGQSEYKNMFKISEAENEEIQRAEEAEELDEFFGDD